jgi:hypothetical protein
LIWGHVTGRRQVPATFTPGAHRGSVLASDTKNTEKKAEKGEKSPGKCSEKAREIHLRRAKMIKGEIIIIIIIRTPREAGAGLTAKGAWLRTSDWH